MGCIKYLLFIFNLIFALSGLAFLIAGVIIHLQLTNLSDILSEKVVVPSVTLIVVGSIIFIIAFFGCCGAIRESHCMIVTFAVILLTILIVQVAMAIYAFIVVKDPSDLHIDDNYSKFFNTYWTKSGNRDIIDTIQGSLKCCGKISSIDYLTIPSGNGTIPWSCCDGGVAIQCTRASEIYTQGCVEAIEDFIKKSGVWLGGLAIAIAVVELLGIIFALCLANSIRNAERRGYRV